MEATTLAVYKDSSGDSLTISLEGRLDTTTAPQLESEVKSCLDGVKSLVFDMKALEFLSSAGLRVLLIAQKAIAKQGGSMVVKNLIPSVRKVFDVTGFSRILKIEQ